MAECHMSVDTVSNIYRDVERRYNYTTPKSFLELISYFKSLLEVKRLILDAEANRRLTGIDMVNKTKLLVEDLVIKNQAVQVRASEKAEAAAELIKKMSIQQAIVKEQQDLAQIEKDKAELISERSFKVKNEATTALALAEPKKKKAEAALKGLTAASIDEVKRYSSMPGQSGMVSLAILITLGYKVKGKLSDMDNEAAKAADFGQLKTIIKTGKEFKERLENFKIEDPKVCKPELIPILDEFCAHPAFQQEFIPGETIIDPFTGETVPKPKELKDGSGRPELPFWNNSQAAANMAQWLINSVSYWHVYQMVSPLEAAAKAAGDEFEEASNKLQAVEAKVKGLQDQLAKLMEQLTKATNEKKAVEDELKAGQDKLNLAYRLVRGLEEQYNRWSKEVAGLEERKRCLVGDVCVSSAFVSYVGAFNQKYRNLLWREKWIPDLDTRKIPYTPGLDPLDVLAGESDKALWKNEGLASDRISLENGALCTQAKRWPLMIDPQLQGLKWMMSPARKYKNGLRVLQLNEAKWVKKAQECLSGGLTLLIENTPEDIDATLDPVLSRSFKKSGGSNVIRCGDEVDYDEKNFRLILQCKLSNPHYKPEIAAQCTLINFIVTEEGLQDQLLASVVNREKPELEKKRADLVKSINEYLIQLSGLEDDLLKSLSNAAGTDILKDDKLVVQLEKTKAAAIEVERKVEMAKKQEIQINAVRNEYTQVAAEGSWLFFMIIQFNVIDWMYQYSLDAFNIFFMKAMNRATKSEVTTERVKFLRECIRLTIFTWVNRGLFERHKPILQSQLCFKLMAKGALQGVEFSPKGYEYLIRGLRKSGAGADEKKLDWTTTAQWEMIEKLAEYDGFDKLIGDMQAASNRFKEWYNKARPESTPLPGEWRKLDDNNPFMKLMIIRALRNDRMTTAIVDYVRKTLPYGSQYTESDAGKSFLDVLAMSLEDSSNTSPVFFILSPGTDPVGSVEVIAKKNGIYEHKYHRIALGEGQDTVAEDRLRIGHDEGHWVCLENIHLMPKWCVKLEKMLDDFATKGSHPEFRVFLSAEPSRGIPIGLLERSIKLTQEPPSGLKLNIQRALASFPRESFEEKDAKIKSITFVLCHFHSIMIERIKFGAKGWNRTYPFNTGDLMCSSQVLENYLDGGSEKIPWHDLRYIIGEILYGGHITDDLDRLLCRTYLEYYMQEELLDEMDLFPFAESYPDDHFKSPPVLTHEQYNEYIETQLPAESPVAFGLHPNAEISVKTTQAERLFTAILELQPRSGGGAGESNPIDAVKTEVKDILDEIKGIKHDIETIRASIDPEQMGPYQNVFLQECERMNILAAEIRRSLVELMLGLDGELQMSDRMEALQTALFMGRVPETWALLAYPSLRSLSGWRQNLLLRQEQIEAWVSLPTEIPKVCNLASFFNPQSFLTAIMQKYAQNSDCPLDKLVIQTSATRRMNAKDQDTAARTGGAYVCGLFLEGAKWNFNQMYLEECEPRQMFFSMPVILCMATPVDRVEKTGVYMCPVYKTQSRGPTFVYYATLRSKQPSAKWVLGGVVMLLEADV